MLKQYSETSLNDLNQKIANLKARDSFDSSDDGNDHESNSNSQTSKKKSEGEKPNSLTMSAKDLHSDNDQIVVEVEEKNNTISQKNLLDAGDNQLGQTDDGRGSQSRTQVEIKKPKLKDSPVKRKDSKRDLVHQVT